VNITVTTANGTSATSSADQFTYEAAPTVTAVSPTSGSTAGGTSVTITGTNLASATAVDFGSDAASVTSDSATQIVATSPAESAATVNITVTTANGTSATSSADQFTYRAASVLITPVGTFTSTTGTGVTTLAVTPKTLGDVLVVFAMSSTTASTVSSLSGGGVASWTKGVQFAGTGGVDTEIWFGRVTTTGSSTVTFTWSKSISGDYAEYGAEEFSAGLGASTVWSLDKTGSANGASSTSVPFPSLTPSSSGELYFGYAEVANTAAAGSTSGFTYAVTADGNVVTYDPDVSGAVAPSATQSPAGLSTSVGVLLSAS
jgi:hypothetical protein